jgi:hypothetical protein
VVTQISGQTTHLVVGVEPGAKKVSDADKHRTPKIDLKELRTLLDTIKRQALVDLARPSTGMNAEVHAAAASAAVSAIMNAAVPAAAASAVVSASTDADANQQKHFGYFLKNHWTIIECGGGGACFFHSVLILNKIHGVVNMFKSHGALRRQVCQHVRDNFASIFVSQQPIMTLIAPRGARFMSRMRDDATYVEYEIVCAFSHLVQTPVIVYTLHARLPQVQLPYIIYILYIFINRITGHFPMRSMLGRPGNFTGHHLQVVDQRRPLSSCNFERFVVVIVVVVVVVFILHRIVQAEAAPFR